MWFLTPPLTQLRHQFHVVVVGDFVFHQVAAAGAAVVEHPAFFARVAHGNGGHEAVAGGGAVAGALLVHVQRIKALGAMVAAAAGKLGHVGLAVSALKRFVDHGKVHISRLTCPRQL